MNGYKMAPALNRRKGQGPSVDGTLDSCAGCVCRTPGKTDWFSDGVRLHDKLTKLAPTHDGQLCDGVVWIEDTPAGLAAYVAARMGV